MQVWAYTCWQPHTAIENAAPKVKVRTGDFGASADDLAQKVKKQIAQ